LCVVSLVFQFCCADIKKTFDFDEMSVDKVDDPPISDSETSAVEKVEPKTGAEDVGVGLAYGEDESNLEDEDERGEQSTEAVTMEDDGASVVSVMRSDGVVSAPVTWKSLHTSKGKLEKRQSDITVFMKSLTAEERAARIAKEMDGI
jgi:cytoskeletal protein RodZ